MTGYQEVEAKAEEKIPATNVMAAEAYEYSVLENMMSDRSRQFRAAAASDLTF
jgi:hypothetical protein